MKKTVLVLLIAFTMLLGTACGGDTVTESKAPSSEAESSALTESGVGDGAVNENSDDSSVADSSVPQVDPIYFDVYGWQGDMFFGYVNNNGEGYYGVIDAKGETVFNLEDGKYFAGSLKNDDTNAFYGDYALLKDNTIINRKGEKVFDLSATDFDAIYYHECLDVGYVLCSKEVNTFEETGTHYFAVKIADGSSYKFESDMKPMSPGHYYYFGNGIFIYSKANGGFGTNHTFFNILTKEEYAGYRLDEEGEKVYEYLPDLYFYDGFKGDSTTKPTVNGHFIAKSSETIVDCDLATGLWTITEIKDILEVDSVMSDKPATAPYIYMMKYSGESYGSERFMIDIRTGKYLMMNDYKSYDILSYVSGVGYLATVTNEGGGKFVTVIKEDGSRAFDPIATTLVQCYGNSLFVIKGDNGNMMLYNWKGEKVKEWETKLNKAVMGENSVMIVTMLDGTLSSLLYTKDGKEINITAMESLAEVKSTVIEGFSGGCYVYENLLVNEKGEAFVLRMN
ncbi:MAG: hypothetical protein IJC49_02580 [Clostridia bacterium]|nr:hypothetical protein [Clostridia bacterium]